MDLVTARTRRRAWAAFEIITTVSQYALWIYLGWTIGHLLKGCAS
jgi:hypothetical protein